MTVPCCTRLCGAFQILVVALTCLACGCVPPGGERLRVGVLLWPPYELAFLARERGFIDDRRIALIEYSSPAVAVRDYRNGVLDAVTLTTNYVLQIAESEVDHRIVLSIDESKGGDLVMARSDIESIDQLRGRRVGVEASALGAYVLARALALHDVEVEELTIVPIDLEEQYDRFVAGEIDAVATYEPFAEQLRARGGHAIFDSSRLAGEIIDVLLTRQSTIESRREDLRHLVNGWLRAEELLRREPGPSFEFMAGREGLEPERFAELLEASAIVHDRADNLRLLAGRPPALRGVIDEVYENSLRYGLLKGPVDVAVLLDGSLVQSSSEGHLP